MNCWCRGLLVCLALTPWFFHGVQVGAAELKGLLKPVPGSERYVAPKAEGKDTQKEAPVQPGGTGILLTEAELGRAIQADLPKRFPVKGELRVQLARPWLTMRLPGQDFFAECIQIPEGGLRSNMSVTVRGVSGGKIVGEWPLQIRVELWDEVWMVPQRLERGQVLVPGMLVAQKVDLMRELGQPISAETDVAGYELAQAVIQGRPLSRRDLVERSLVKRGQFVDAVAAEGGLTIRMRALALEGGAAGAVIRVRNLDSNKEFVGEVVGENRVQVRF